MNKLVILALMFATTEAEADAIEMNVYGLICGRCAQGIEKTLREHPATADVISLENTLVAVTTKPGTGISDVELTKAITAAGYTVKEIARTQRCISEIRSALRAAN